MRFAFYGRGSTEDAQDPAASRTWQLPPANDLISAAGGQVVAEYFDVGQSRSIPWKRRPEAARLLTDHGDAERPSSSESRPGRSTAANSGSPSRCSPNIRVGLWVPEVGGAIDPGSEAHDLVMTPFGGVSKGERTRIKVRVRSAMEAEIVTPEALAASQQAPPETAARASVTKAAIAVCDLLIERLMESVEKADMPMEWVSRRIVELRNERDRLEKTLPTRSEVAPALGRGDRRHGHHAGRIDANAAERESR